MDCESARLVELALSKTDTTSHRTKRTAEVVIGDCPTQQTQVVGYFKICQPSSDVKELLDSPYLIDFTNLGVPLVLPTFEIVSKTS